MFCCGSPAIAVTWCSPSSLCAVSPASSCSEARGIDMFFGVPIFHCQPCIATKWLARNSRCDLVDVAPDPVFAWFNGPNQWMFGVAEVLAGMFIFRGIAATDMSALQAHP